MLVMEERRLHAVDVVKQQQAHLQGVYLHVTSAQAAAPSAAMPFLLCFCCLLSSFYRLHTENTHFDLTYSCIFHKLESTLE